MSRMRSSTTRAPGRSFLLAKTNSGTPARAGSASREWSSDVAVGRLLGYTGRWSASFLLLILLCSCHRYPRRLRPPRTCIMWSARSSASRRQLAPKTYTTAFAPPQYLSHIDLNLGCPCVFVSTLVSGVGLARRLGWLLGRWDWESASAMGRHGPISRRPSQSLWGRKTCAAFHPRGRDVCSHGHPAGC